MTRRKYRYIDIYMKKSLEKEVPRKVSINFPRELWKQLKARAVEEETTVTEILMRLCRQYLAKGKAKGGR